jgi:hypothetical protein
MLLCASEAEEKIYFSVFELWDFLGHTHLEHFFEIFDDRCSSFIYNLGRRAAQKHLILLVLQFSNDDFFSI